MEVEDFIKINNVDESAADMLRSASPTVQRTVIGRGELKTARNPSSALLSRIRDAKHSGSSQHGHDDSHRGGQQPPPLGMPPMGMPAPGSYGYGYACSQDIPGIHRTLGIRALLSKTAEGILAPHHLATQAFQVTQATLPCRPDLGHRHKEGKMVPQKGCKARMAFTMATVATTVHKARMPVALLQLGRRRC